MSSVEDLANLKVPSHSITSSSPSLQGEDSINKTTHQTMRSASLKAKPERSYAHQSKPQYQKVLDVIANRRAREARRALRDETRARRTAVLKFSACMILILITFAAGMALYWHRNTRELSSSNKRLP